MLYGIVLNKYDGDHDLRLLDGQALVSDIGQHSDHEGKSEHIRMLIQEADEEKSSNEQRKDAVKPRDTFFDMC